MNFSENNKAIINGNKTIPCDENNIDYRLIKYGDEDLDIAPIIDDIDAYEPPETDPQVQINADNLTYLASTDWYVLRLAETAVAIPSEISTARQTAREAIV